MNTFSSHQKSPITWGVFIEQRFTHNRRATSTALKNNDQIIWSRWQIRPVGRSSGNVGFWSSYLPCQTKPKQSTSIHYRLSMNACRSNRTSYQYRALCVLPWVVLKSPFCRLNRPGRVGFINPRLRWPTNRWAVFLSRFVSIFCFAVRQLSLKPTCFRFSSESFYIIFVQYNEYGGRKKTRPIPA